MLMTKLKQKELEVENECKMLTRKARKVSTIFTNLRKQQTNKIELLQFELN